MAEETNAVAEEAKGLTEGDGFAVGHLDQMGDGPGFRKVRRALGVQERGVNAIVMPADTETGFHFHDEQEELYFVHRGRLEMEFGDGSKHLLGPGSFVRVDAPTHRKVRAVGDEDVVYVVVGAKGGYVGRDGKRPEGEEQTSSSKSE